MKITATEAKPFFEHKSQRARFAPDDLHDNGLLFYADGPVCGVGHYGFESGVWMVHYGMKREGLGRYDKHIMNVLNEFWDDVDAKLIIGWTPESNRLALAIAKRAGFRITGFLDLEDRIEI